VPEAALTPAGAATTPPGAGSPPLCVELDRALVATDLLWECVLVLLRKRPWQVPGLLLASLRRGRAHLQRELARRAPLDVTTLPYRAEVVEYLRRERERGREVLLVTGADESLAGRVAGHLGCFTGVLASDGRTHLAGPRKREAIRERLGGPFRYLAGAGADPALWKAADAAVLVAPPRRLRARVERAVPVEAVFPAPPRGPGPFVRALRPHQWVKNVLILVPVLLDHRLLDLPVVAAAALAVVAFSLAASGGYVLNDVLDIEADRKHPVKRFRPFAEGALSPATGAALVPLLFAAAIGISLLALPATFVLLLAGYVVLTSAYSLYLKRIAVLDVILLAGLYTLRILAGIAATNVRFSAWLLAFSMFLFLSLAFMKRYAELSRSAREQGERVARRSYAVTDLDWLRSMGGSSGYLSVLVLALYLSSDEVVGLYDRPEALWLICPLLLFWISRMWFRAHRGNLDEDPIVATARDPVSYGIGVLVAAVLLAAL
jgi:4-hydroxybenzoate polyprenyltransferase